MQARLIRFGSDSNQQFHTFRHTDSLGLARDSVQAAILKQLLVERDSITAGVLYKGHVKIEEVTLEFHAFQLADGAINVGRITAATPRPATAPPA